MSEVTKLERLSRCLVSLESDIDDARGRLDAAQRRHESAGMPEFLKYLEGLEDERAELLAAMVAEGATFAPGFRVRG